MISYQFQFLLCWEWDFWLRTDCCHSNSKPWWSCISSGAKRPNFSSRRLWKFPLQTSSCSWFACTMVSSRWTDSAKVTTLGTWCYAHVSVLHSQTRFLWTRVTYVFTYFPGCDAGVACSIATVVGRVWCALIGTSPPLHVQWCTLLCFINKDQENSMIDWSQESCRFYIYTFMDCCMSRLRSCYYLLLLWYSIFTSLVPRPFQEDCRGEKGERVWEPFSMTSNDKYWLRSCRTLTDRILQLLIQCLDIIITGHAESSVLST